MTRLVQRSLAAVAALVASTLLVGCGGPSAYCESVEENADLLESFGQDRTDAGYTRYAETFSSMADLAPEDVQEEWTQLATVTRGVLEAQEEVGVPLEEMRDDDAVAELSSDDLSTLNEAYEAFNGTGDQRTAVVTNVKQECDITLD